MTRLPIAIPGALCAFTLIAVAALTGLADGDGAPGAPDATRPVPVVKGVPKKPTYHKHVAKVLQRRCTTCHHEGDIAPMSLDNYEDAADWIDLALEEIGAGRMPPWQPTRGVGRFHGERELTDREWATLARWSEQGALEGRPRKNAKPPEYAQGWTLGTPDAVLSYGEAFRVPGEGDDIYRCFPIKTDFGEDVFVQAIDVQPGDRRIVHHVVLYIDTTDEAQALDAAEDGPGYTCFGGPGLRGLDEIDSNNLDLNSNAGLVLGGWAPGNRPSRLPEGLGIRIPAGATVIMQVHYHPIPGEPVAEQTEFGLYFTDDPAPEDVYLLPLINTNFTIPAGDAAYEVTAELGPSALIAEATGFPVQVAAQVHAVLPHMHLLGKAIAVDLDLADGTTQRLVEINDWDFNWQGTYQFEEAVPAPFGSSLRLTCVFDNSADNPFNPSSPPQAISWGEQTVDEMALAFVAVSLRFPDNVLDLMEFLGQPLPHRRGLKAITSDRPPEIRRARIDKKGRLVLSVKRLNGGGRIEVDGEPLADSLVRSRNPRRMKVDVSTSLVGVAVGTTLELRIRRTDGRLSEPFQFTR